MKTLTAFNFIQYFSAKKLFCFLMGIFLFSPSFAKTPPALDIHFFADDTAELNIASHATENSTPKMQMVIFTADQQHVNAEQSSYTEQEGFSFTYYIDSSYQQDSINWSVASPTGRPDTLTEIEWKNVSFIGFDAGFKAAMPYGIVLKGDAGYAWEVSGNNHQIFYAGDGRTQAFSNIEANANNSRTWHGSVALGYTLDFGSINTDPIALNITPLAGYAWREQNLKSNNGKQRLTTFNQTDPTSLTQENTYNTHWYGPWLGADITLSAFKKHQLFSSLQHHWANYKAEGYWRQSQDIQQPKSFEHKTDATGIVASAGYRYLTDDLWGLSVSVDYQKWEGDSGSETLYTVNDEQFNSKLNDVDWKSLGINLGVNLNF